MLWITTHIRNIVQQYANEELFQEVDKCKLEIEPILSEVPLSFSQIILFILQLFGLPNIFWEVPPGSSIYSPSSCLYDGPLLPNHPSWEDFLVLPCPSLCPGEKDIMYSVVLASLVIFVFLSALQEKAPNI